MYQSISGNSAPDRSSGTSDADPSLIDAPDLPSSSSKSYSSSAGFLGSSSQALLGQMRKRPPRTIGAVSVVAITFFNVCGGPWGSEEMVSDAGPLPGLIGLLLFGIMWGIPLAGITAELSSAYPDDGVYSLWVGEAFGEFWAFLESYFSWFSGVVDNAVYPGLVFSALMNVLQEVGGAASEHAHFMAEHPFMIRIAIATIFMLPNLLCIRSVGKSMAVLVGIVMAPFFVMIVICVPRIRWHRLVQPPWQEGSGSGGPAGPNASSAPLWESTPSPNAGGHFAYPTSWGAGWGDLLASCTGISLVLTAFLRLREK